eukprot:4452136-Lingulodinium_polyedra.AAC.1
MAPPQRFGPIRPAPATGIPGRAPEAFIPEGVAGQHQLLCALCAQLVQVGRVGDIQGVQGTAQGCL